MKRWIVALWAVAAALWPMLALAQDTGEGGSTPLDSLSTYAIWAIAAGFIGSWVVAVINQTHWKSTVKFAVFFVYCVAAAGVDAYFKRELDWANWSRALLLVFVSGQFMYFAAKPAIKEVELATSINQATT